MFIYRKTQFCQDVSSSQLDLQIQYNPIQILASDSTVISKADAEVYTESQTTQKSQSNIEREQSWRVDSTRVQDLL
jgi:hypothetical protein